MHGDDGMQLRLGTSLQSQVELTAVRDNFIDYWLHLVHLDGIDHVVVAFVLILLAGLLETAPCLLNTVVKDVRKTKQYG